MIFVAVALVMAGPLALCLLTWLCDWSADRSPVHTDVAPWGTER